MELPKKDLKLLHELRQGTYFRKSVLLTAGLWAALGLLWGWMALSFSEDSNLGLSDVFDYELTQSYPGYALAAMDYYMRSILAFFTSVLLLVVGLHQRRMGQRLQRILN